MGKRIKKVVLGTCALTAAVHCCNKMIFKYATRRNLLDDYNGKKYNTKFGDIFYNVKGTGTPLLLIHDLDCASSGYEWDNIVDKLAENHKVFVIDLLGCGRADKPEISYTSYMYVQIISGFIRDIIDGVTDVVATGKSASIVCMLKNLYGDLVDKIIAISPEYIKKASYIKSDKIDYFIKKIYNSPVAGTVIYNFNYSKNLIEEKFEEDYLYDCKNVYKFTNIYYESSHLKGSSCKYLFTSLYFNYLNSNPLPFIKNYNSSEFLIIMGENNNYYDRIVKLFNDTNENISIEKISNSKYLPQIEKPAEVCEIINRFLI